MKGLRKDFGRLGLEDDDYWDDDEEYPAYEEEEYVQKSASGSHKEHAAPAADEEGFADDVCAICLSQIEPEELAIVKGCEHMYCVNCILQWAVCKEAPWCPQCKKPFNYLYCHRLLDGTLTDAPVEESVCLLKRATWFVEHVKTLEKGKAVSAEMAAAEVPLEWADAYYDEEDDFDEEGEIEKYYFSSAAGAARVVIGNRRLGENGFMRAGRMYARPVNNSGGSGSGAGGSGSIGKAGKGRAAGANGGGSGGKAGPSSGAGGSGAAAGAGASSAAPSKGQGRRAKRNARRAATDVDFEL